MRALDNMNYKRMKKILVTDVSTEGNDVTSDAADHSNFDSDTNGPLQAVREFLNSYFLNFIEKACKSEV